MADTGSQTVRFGEVFTRRWVVETILDLVGYTSDRQLATMTLIEPAVGMGAFLGPIIERLVAAAIRAGTPFEALVNAVRCYDLQLRNVEHCREVARRRLEAEGASPGVASALSRSWIRHADFLLEDIDFPADFVVGNPPYIRSEEIDDFRETAYRSRWPTMWGRADIYVGFFERSLTLLREEGRLGFICADRWMRNAYGSRLRKFIAENFAVETVWQMHDVDAFVTSVSAYPAITVLSRCQQGSVAVVDTTSEFCGRSAPNAVDFVRSGPQTGAGPGWSGARLDHWFDGDDLWPSATPSLMGLIEDLVERFPPLEQTGGDTRISIGVASGADAAYIVDPNADIEPDRLLPLVMADDVRRGVLEGPRRVLINPWDSHGNLVDLKKYPRMARALASHPSVGRRFVAQKHPESWHRTIDKVYPGLAERPKLLLQDMKAQITPVLEPGGLYPHHNLYYIVSTGWDLEVLGGLLLSRIAEAFIDAYGVKMRGGTLRFQAQYLRKIRVPRPEAIDPILAQRLAGAFRARDRVEATRAAETAYGLPEGTMDSIRVSGQSRHASLFD